MADQVVSARRHVRQVNDINAVIAEEPDIRIYFCDSIRCEDGVMRASFAAKDVRAICSKHGFNVSFLDFFVGRNRTVTDAWKRYEDEHDPNRVTSYGQLF